MNSRNKSVPLSGLAGLLIACLAAPAIAGDFIDTRLSFVFADDNILAGAGETTPSSPNARFGAGNQNTQFYDNVNTRFSGFETLSNLVLYKRMPSFFEGLVTEAALHALLLERTSGGISLFDSSSYIRLLYTPSSWGKNENISLTGFPVSTDRFRLGYVYRLTWGGSGAFTNRALANGVPGMKVQVTRDRWYAYLGAKTALILNDINNEQETNYGLLTGAGFDVTSTLKLEIGGGYFQKGIVPGLANQRVRAPVNALGASARAVYHVGTPVGTSIDLKLYRNDPEAFETFFRPEQYPGGLSYSISVEGSYLTQTLEDPDVFGRTVVQPAPAGALLAQFKYNFARFGFTGLYRSLAFIQFEVPGVPPFKDFPEGTDVQPEIWGAVHFDYHFPRLHFTPGVVVGVQQPAAYTSPSTEFGGNNPPPSLLGTRTVVVRDVNLFSILPSGTAPELIYSAKVTGRWDLSEMVSTIGEVYYTRDTNRVNFRDDVSGVAEPSFEKPDGIGFNAVIQARF